MSDDGEGEDAALVAQPFSLYEFFRFVLHICYGFGTIDLSEKGTMEERKGSGRRKAALR